MLRVISLKTIYRFALFCVIFEIILGNILHFTYDWSNKNALVGAFSAVNESTWEHLKLAFFPMLISTLIGLKLFKNEPKYLCARIIAIIVALVFITAFFYTYTGSVGFNVAILDISSFLIAIILGEVTFVLALKHNFNCNENVSKFILITLTILFVAFTYYPPNIPLFRDPLTKTYEIQK